MRSIFVNPNISLISALESLKLSGKKCLVIVDKNKKLLGTLTDGDLRTIIISGQKLNKSIKKFYNKKPKFIYEDRFNIKNIRKDFIKERYELIPIVSKNKKVKKIITWDEAFQNKPQIKNNLYKKVNLVIMAGGLGSRLRPFTNILPKPLIPINEKPVLEHILNNFNDVGIKDFFISINYKSKIIKSYCEELRPKYNIKFILEKKPLGTIGSLKLFRPKNNKPIFVSNSDIIIKSNLYEMYNFHKLKKNDLTLMAAAKKIIIPYGVCKLGKNGYLKSIDEKPKQDTLINTGLYLINPDIVKIIPSNKICDIDDFLNDIKKKGKKIGVFPISDDSWIDVGQWDEYRKAEEKFSNY